MGSSTEQRSFGTYDATFTAEVKKIRDKKNEISSWYGSGLVQMAICTPTGKIFIHLTILQPLTLWQPILSQHGAFITFPIALLSICFPNSFTSFFIIHSFLSKVFPPFFFHVHGQATCTNSQASSLAFSFSKGRVIRIYAPNTLDVPLRPDSFREPGAWQGPWKSEIYR